MSRFAGLAAPSRVPPALATTPAPELLLLDARSGDALADAELVRRAALGEEWAHAMIYRRHVGLVAATARRLLRNAAEVDDVVQETFLIVFEKLGDLLDGEVLRGWLVKIALSRVHRRFRWRRFVALLGAEGPEALLAEQASTEASPEQRAELALVDRALASLRASVREAWILRHVVGCQLDEVALACDCSLATAKRRIACAEAHVRLHLGEES
jgi:RNA polymerase sigma-70 factor (ECF subfamily)